VNARWVVRIGAKLSDALYLVVVSPERADQTMRQGAATRFESADAAREEIRKAMLRGDPLTHLMRPSRLGDVRVIRRTKEG